MSFVSWLAIAACSGGEGSDDGKDDGPPTGTEPPLPIEIVATAEISPLVPTVANVTFTAPEGAMSWVEFGLEGEDLSMSSPPVADAVPLIPLLGMKAGRTYTWRAVAEVDGVRSASEEGTITLAPTPDAFTAVVTDRVDAKMAAGNFVLTMARNDGTASHAVVYDRDGDLVWYMSAPSDSRDAHTGRFTRDGKRIAFGFYDQSQDDELGGIYTLPLNGLGEVGFTRTALAHHDFQELADGRWSYLALYYERNLDVEGVPADIVTDTIVEVANNEQAGENSVSVFNYLYDSGLPLWWVCTHMEEDFLTTDFKQWTHSNSLMLDPVEPERYYWVLSRYQDALVKIDREDHALVQQIGGLYATVPQVGGQWSHPHMSHLWDGGFMMFNNNTHLEGNSTAQEWAFDGFEATLVHEWTGNKVVGGMADARKLANGNALIGWTIEDSIEERTVDDEIVWRLELDKVFGGRIVLVDDLYTPDEVAWDPTAAQ